MKQKNKKRPVLCAFLDKNVAKVQLGKFAGAILTLCQINDFKPFDFVMF